jgi:ribonuclease BN (tRNA processing enzyme)
MKSQADYMPPLPESTTAEFVTDERTTHPSQLEDGLNGWLLGTGGWMPTSERQTLSVLLRDGDHALLLDAGSGASRLITSPELLRGVTRLDIALTHFHLDHICGLLYLPALELTATIWAPGTWLYGRPSADILAAIAGRPVSPFAQDAWGAVHELQAGVQQLGRFDVSARAQPRHWAPTAGLRVGSQLALITDTAFEQESGRFAEGVSHLLHEAWSTSLQPASTEGDSTAAQAGEVAAIANAKRLTLVHLQPLTSAEALLEDARRTFGAVEVGVDGAELALD